MLVPSRTRHDVENPSASDSPPPEPVQYTRTGRISKAKKGRRVHYCDCGRSYARAEHLRRHQKIHAQEDALVCDFPECGKTFYRIDLLQRHQERHDKAEEVEKVSRPRRNRSTLLVLDAPWGPTEGDVGFLKRHPSNDLSWASADSGYASVTSPLLRSAPSSSDTSSSITVSIDQLESGMPWSDPFNMSHHPKNTTSSGLLSPGYEHDANMFGNSGGSAPNRTRTSSNASFIEPWAYPSRSPTSSSSTMAYTWTSSEKNTAASANVAYMHGTSYPMTAAPMSYGNFASNSSGQRDDEEQALFFPGQSFDMAGFPIPHLDPSLYVPKPLYDTKMAAHKKLEEKVLPQAVPSQPCGSSTSISGEQFLHGNGKVECIKSSISKMAEGKVKKEEDIEKEVELKSLCIVMEDDIEKSRIVDKEVDLTKVKSIKEEGYMKNEDDIMERKVIVPVKAVPLPTFGPEARASKWKFTPEEDDLLVVLKEKKGLTWEQIGEFFPETTSDILRHRYHAISKSWHDFPPIDVLVCPLQNHDGTACQKRCTSEKRYRTIQEHIRRAHPEKYIPKLPFTHKSFCLMTNVIDRSAANLHTREKTLSRTQSRERSQSPDNLGRDSPPLQATEQTLDAPAKDHSHAEDTAQWIDSGETIAPHINVDDMISDTESSDLGSSTDESDLSSPSTSSSIHSLVISARSRMIDTLMRQVHISISDLSIAPVACAANGSSQTTSAGSFNSTSTGTSSEKARGKRKNDGDGRDQPDEGDDDNGNKRRKPNDKNVDRDGDQPIRYACPFFKRNPRAHRRTACRYPGFTGVHRMKEHLYRDHIHVHCHRCNMLFKSDEELREHQRGEPCVVSDREPPEGISTTQLARLKSKKRFGKERTEEERWRAIYQYLFPDEDASLVSPYCDDWADGEADGNRLTDYELFCRREFTRRVRQELDQLLEQRAQPLEDDLRAELVGVVQRCRDSLYPDFERQNRSPASASQPSRTAAGPSAVPPPQSQETSQQPPSSLPTLESGSDSDQLPNSLSPHSSSEPNNSGPSFGQPPFFTGLDDFGQQFGSAEYDMSLYDSDYMAAGPSDSGNLFMSTVLQKDAGADVLQYMNGAHQFDGPWDGTSFPHS